MTCRQVSWLCRKDEAIQQLHERADDLQAEMVATQQVKRKQIDALNNQVDRILSVKVADRKDWPQP